MNGTKNYTITARRMRRDPKWVKGTVGKCSFEALVFDEGSEYGIGEGRVSKLWIWNDAERQATGNIFNDIVAYDRGWDRKPAKQHDPIFRAVLAFLEAMAAVSGE